MADKISQGAWNAHLIWIVEQLVVAATKLEGNPSPEKCGGYLTAISIENGIPEIQSRIGELVLEKLGKYRAFSEEKPVRLLIHSEHLTSFQSRDPDNGKWGGAIRAGNYVIGFSGLPELLDEAVVTVAAWHMNLITKDQMKAIVATSNNPFTFALSESMLSIPEMPAVAA